MLEALGHTEVLRALVGLVQNVEVFSREADAPEAVGAAMAIGAEDEVSAAGAARAFDAVRQGMAVDAAFTVRALAASLTVVRIVAVAEVSASSAKCAICT